MASQTMPAPKPRSPIKIGRVVTYALLLFSSVFYILPVYLILLTSFKQYTDINLYRMWDLPPLINLPACTNAFIFCFDSFYEAWFGSEAVIGMGQDVDDRVAESHHVQRSRCHRARSSVSGLASPPRPTHRARPGRGAV